jgi:hypothetical protein
MAQTSSGVMPVSASAVVMRSAGIIAIPQTKPVRVRCGKVCIPFWPQRHCDRPYSFEAPNLNGFPLALKDKYVTVNLDNLR